jgi:hypothetical protein
METPALRGKRGDWQFVETVNFLRPGRASLIGGSFPGLNPGKPDEQWYAKLASLELVSKNEAKEAIP